MLDMKSFSKDDKEYYRKLYISIYDKTNIMKDSEFGKYYYHLTCGGCACALYKNESNIRNVRLRLFDECIEVGGLYLFFLSDDGDYHLIENDVNSYM